MKTKPELEPGKRTILFIGAHPDDPEVNACGLAILFRQKGDSVYIASVTDGCSGCMQADPITTAARRKTEAENSADIIGATSLCLNEKDGYLEPNLMIRMIRNIAPDIIITNRPNDYHPDHRYTAELVQDSAYMLMVPNVAPETPPLHYNPIVFYWGGE